jgi:hypothetical protein
MVMRRAVLVITLAACGAAAPASSTLPAGELPPGPPASATAEMRIHLIDVGQGAATLIEFSCGVDRRDRYSAWAFGHPRIESIELLERALTGAPRERIHVSVGTAHEQFVAHDITAPIYATGWDGDVRVTLHASDGSIHVSPSRSAELHTPSHAGNE